MALTGRDPNCPRPVLAREFIFAAGPSSGIAPERNVLIVGNITASGSETTDVISDDPIADDADARTRMGLRSEAYAMYRKFTEVPQDATIWLCAPPEGTTAALCPFLVSNTSDASTTWEFTVEGEKITYSAQNGDTPQTTAEGAMAAINGYNGGTLGVIVTAPINGAGPNYDIMFTAAQQGTRGDLIIGATATRGVRVRILSGTGNAQTIAKTTGSYVGGGADDDHTATIAEIAGGEYYYQITPKHHTTALTTTDNGAGEHLTMINTQALPINGKSQRLFGGCVGTATQAGDMAEGAGGNSVYGHFFHQENSDWTPAMIAAHCCAVVRQNEITHPGANVNNWTASTNQIFNVPAPFLKADYPTNAEIVSMLNRGVSPLACVNGRVLLERFITSRSYRGTTATSDYGAREGHIPSVIHFCWDILSQRYQSIRQPFADDDSSDDQPPPKNTMVPSLIRAMIEAFIDDMVSDTPLNGTYSGPILKRSARQEMRDSIRVSYAGGGSFPTEVDFKAVDHDIKWEVKVREANDAY